MRAQDFIEWRHRTDLTQDEAAKKFGVTRATVQNWESGTSPVPVPVETSCQIWEERLRQENPNIGPVTLIYADGPMFVNPFGPRQRIAMMHQEPYPTNAAAIARVQALWGRDDFHNALVIEQSGKPLWNIVELDAVVTGRDRGAPTIPNMLRTLAEQLRGTSGIFVRNGPRILTRTEEKERQLEIENVATELDKIAADFSAQNFDSAPTEDLLVKLRKFGKQPNERLVNNLAQAFVSLAISKGR